MNLTLFNKKNQLPSLFDELLDDAFSRFPTSKFMNSQLPAVNIREKENETNFEMFLPGINKSDVKVTVENNVLTVSHERHIEQDKSTNNYIHKEFEQSSFTRSFRLASDSNNEKIESKMENGILTIKVPKDIVKNKKLIEIQ